MATVVKSFSITGIDGYPVDIEASVLNLEARSVNIIGMGDVAVKNNSLPPCKNLPYEGTELV